MIQENVNMNNWINLSIEYANQKSYLDDLFCVYPTIPDGIRTINKEIWDRVESAFCRKNNDLLILLGKNDQPKRTLKWKKRMIW